jgi:mycothiol synthase
MTSRPRAVAAEDWPAVAARLAEVRRQCGNHDGHDPLDEAADRHLRHRGLSQARLWLAGDDGFALLIGSQAHLAVAPTGRGQGVGALLATTALDFVGPSGEVRAWARGDHPAAAALAASHNLARVRELWVERRPTSLALPAVALPPGVTVRGFRDDARDRAALVRVNASAFANHPEQGSMDLAELAERMAEPWFHAEDLLLAEDADGTLLGFHWTKRHDEHHGEVYVVGLDPAAQGRGLGKALVVAGLQHLADLGIDEVVLYVESDNLPARALYESLGFAHARIDTHVQYGRG